MVFSDLFLLNIFQSMKCLSSGNIKSRMIDGMDVCHIFELIGNLTDSAVWNTGEAGDINKP